MPLAPRPDPGLLSIVIPAFNEEEVLPHLRLELATLRASLPCPTEVVFVDDGSRDGTYALLADWARADPSVKVLALSRNFGQQLALAAGLDAARGDAAVVLDADLQDPPALIPEMLAAYREGFDVVYGQRTARHGETWFKKASAHAFYRVMRAFVDERLPADAGEFRLVSRLVLDDLRGLRERDRFTRGLVTWVGYAQKGITYQRPARVAGESKVPVHRLFTFGLTAIVSFSELPIQLIAATGVCVMLAALVLLLASTWPIALFTFLSGVILLSVATVGIYVARGYAELQGRPLYIVRRTHNVDASATRE